MSKKTVHKNLNLRTRGPILDLEKHLPADWWKKIFNSLYLKTDGDVVENKENTELEVNILIKATGIKPDNRFLDLCCGQGRHCIELARRGYIHITGLDLSQYLIRLARKRAASAGFSIAFHKGDTRKLRFPEKSFDCVSIIGNSYGYFERKEDDLKVLESVKDVLCVNGKLFLDISDGEWLRANYAQRSWEWIDRNYFVCRERSLSSDNTRLICREVVIHAGKGVIADQFYAERLYTYGQITDLLKQAGFISIKSNGTITTGSDRNQDLGMMAHRFFLTAVAP
ncbi:MAG: class I SAM-dependent methyltransferase [Proteobacteria bacterium]|nr:class I SAM-dependent methyltransferase [Pseudomonadota bacterium]